MAEWNKRTLKHIDYEEDNVKQWRGNATIGLWCLSGGTWSNPTLTHIGEKYGKTAAQVALRWLLQSDVIISRDVISDMHTTEFHMMLTSDH